MCSNVRVVVGYSLLYFLPICIGLIGMNAESGSNCLTKENQQFFKVRYDACILILCEALVHQWVVATIVTPK